MEKSHLDKLEMCPIRVFVVWHPEFEDGESAFASLYDWLGGPARELYRRGLGVPVHALCGSMKAGPHHQAASTLEPPKEIPMDRQLLTVVIVLIDGNIVGRKDWRDWVDRLPATPASHGTHVLVLPWAVHPAASSLRQIGTLQLVGSGQVDPRQLCRRVTELCVVHLRDPDRPAPLRVFISYARKDGETIAHGVRRALQAYGYLTVFMDAHDLQPGRKWRFRLTEEMVNGAAMFAIVTDAYASRAWCREELRNFRKPVWNSVRNLWCLRPVYILDCLSGAATRSMFEVGNAPTVRWLEHKRD